MRNGERDLFDGRAPLRLAEHLEAEYSVDLLQRFNRKSSASGRLTSAWNHVEYGMNSSVSIGPDLRIDYLDYAQSLVGMVLGRQEAGITAHMKALVLSSYITTFKKRALGLEVTRDDCTDIYRSLGGAFGHIRPLEHGEVPSAVALETFTLALSARTRVPEYLLYPTSPREEASAVQALNHDSYFIHDGEKLPLQQKLIPTDVEYGESITMLTLLPIIDGVYRKYKDVGVDTIADKLNYPISLMVAEAAQERLPQQDKAILDHLSESIVWHYLRAQESVDSLAEMGEAA